MGGDGRRAQPGEFERRKCISADGLTLAARDYPGPGEPEAAAAIDRLLANVAEPAAA